MTEPQDTPESMASAKSTQADSPNVPDRAAGVAAMMAAVELEISAVLGLVTTAAIGRMIQKAIDAAAPQWQDVDTAPLDRDVLLGWWRTWPELFWEVTAGPAGSTKGRWLHGQATHWIPLPPPPVAADGSRKE
jgi:hypothetical protein